MVPQRPVVADENALRRVAERDAHGWSAASEHKKMGCPSQSSGGRRCTQRRDHDRGGVPGLPTLGRRVPFLGARVRAPWPCWFARYAHSAISRIAVSTNPLPHRGKQPIELSRLRGTSLSNLIFRRVELMTDPGIEEALPMSEPQNSAPPPDSAHYREIADKLRELARQCRFPGARRELLDLAASYERRADHLECRAR